MLIETHQSEGKIKPPHFYVFSSFSAVAVSLLSALMLSPWCDLQAGQRRSALAPLRTKNQRFLKSCHVNEVLKEVVLRLSSPDPTLPDCNSKVFFFLTSGNTH